MISTYFVQSFESLRTTEVLFTDIIAEVTEVLMVSSYAYTYRPEESRYGDVFKST